jgi:hypothetical protein
MKKPISMIILAMGLTCSAEPQAVTILSPEAPEGHFEMGREYITLSNGNIGAELGFDGTCEENLVFDLVIFNNSGRPLSFDPSDFYYELLESADADSPMLPPRMARDPEEILDRYEEELEEAEMEKGFNTFLGFTRSGRPIIMRPVTGGSSMRWNRLPMRGRSLGRRSSEGVRSRRVRWSAVLYFFPGTAIRAI